MFNRMASVRECCVCLPPVGGLLDPLSTGRCQGSYQMPKVASLEVERKGGGPAWGWFHIPEVWS